MSLMSSLKAVSQTIVVFLAPDVSRREIGADVRSAPAEAEPF